MIKRPSKILENNNYIAVVLNGIYGGEKYFLRKSMSGGTERINVNDKGLGKILGEQNNLASIPMKELKVDPWKEGISDSTPLIGYFNIRTKKLVELIDPLSQKIIWNE